jgi:hypothetical protein
VKASRRPGGDQVENSRRRDDETTLVKVIGLEG